MYVVVAVLEIITPHTRVLEYIVIEYSYIYELANSTGSLTVAREGKLKNTFNRFHRTRQDEIFRLEIHTCIQIQPNYTYHSQFHCSQSL